MIDTHGKTNAELGEIIAGLVEERDHYKRELGMSASGEQFACVCGRLKLTRCEASIVLALHAKRGRTMTKEALMTAAYQGMDEPVIKIIDVFVCKARKKIGADKIGTAWGLGYYLTPAGIELVDAALLVGSC